MIALRRRGYGASAGYGSGRLMMSRSTSAAGSVSEEHGDQLIEPQDLLTRKPSDRGFTRGRATIILGPAASGKTTIMIR